MFGLQVVEDPENGSLTYRYNDDHKRPAPLAADISAAYPDLKLSHEFTDEFGGIAGRQSYANGVCLENVTFDADQLDWVEWNHEE
jgi:hypothetical protein